MHILHYSKTLPVASPTNLLLSRRYSQLCRKIPPLPSPHPQDPLTFLVERILHLLLLHPLVGSHSRHSLLARCDFKHLCPFVDRSPDPHVHPSSHRSRNISCNLWFNQHSIPRRLCLHQRQPLPESAREASFCIGLFQQHLESAVGDQGLLSADGQLGFPHLDSVGAICHLPAELHCLHLHGHLAVQQTQLAHYWSVDVCIRLLVVQQLGLVLGHWAFPRRRRHQPTSPHSTLPRLEQRERKRENALLGFGLCVFGCGNRPQVHVDCRFG